MARLSGLNDTRDYSGRDRHHARAAAHQPSRRQRAGARTACRLPRARPQRRRLPVAGRSAAEQEIYKRFAQFDAKGDRQLSPTEYLAAREDNERRSRHDAIAVETYEGRVQLSGFVPLPDMASRAGRVTAGVNGVRSVHNNISVK
jgi:osmotically-inducible protein OsmY